MSESHVVSGLLSKREEIAGQIATIQAEILAITRRANAVV